MGNLNRKRRKERRLGRRAAQLAWDAFEISDLESAERLLRQALRGHEGDCVLWHDLGVVLWRREKLKEGEKALRNALALRPDYEDAKTQLASLLAARGFFRQALRLQEEVLKDGTACREFHEKRAAEYRQALERLGEDAEEG